MEAAVSYLLRLQKYINAKQKTQKKKKKTGLKGVIKFFSDDFNPIDTNNILDNHKYFMKRT